MKSSAVCLPFFKRVGFESLPREVAPQEIHEHVAQGLEVIPPGLFLAQVSVDAHVASRASQALVLPEISQKMPKIAKKSLF